MSEVVVKESTNPYSRLLSWEVWNFMTLEHGKVDFDDSNIINIKGYNDSGKSAMLRALDVLFFNIKPNSQVGFIQDGKDYFRVQAYFSDGVVILRDKYLNGQSLYEMYKDGTCLFSTKQGKTLTKVADVPQVIKDYLGMITCDSVVLNSRNCFEKQLLVQTTGSENYKVLNVILKSEEIAVASEMLNTDKNKMASDIYSTDTAINTFKSELGTAERLLPEAMKTLKSLDSDLDKSDARLNTIAQVQGYSSQIAEIEDFPALDTISAEQLTTLNKISEYNREISSIPDIPSLAIVDVNRLLTLAKIKSATDDLKNLKLQPNVPSADVARVNLLNSLHLAVQEYLGIEQELKSVYSQLEALTSEQASLQKELEAQGKKYVRCKNCGAMVEVDSPHAHS